MITFLTNFWHCYVVQNERNRGPFLKIFCRDNYMALEKGAIINQEVENSLYPLHCALYNGHMETVVFLIESGARPDLRQGHIIYRYLQKEPSFAFL